MQYSWCPTGILLGLLMFQPAVAGPLRQRSDPLVPAPASRVAVQLSGPSQPARPGLPFVVAAEVTPRAGIHVYAPGNRDYIPVALTLDWPQGVRVKEPVYPPGEPFIFGPLKEVVTTYHRPFRITQQATVFAGTPAARARSLEITGVLRYQACDERICFPVDSIPLRLTIPLDATRKRSRGK
jgi:DsbC/DsbD-like thiol-disulfide interchange protein